MHGSSFEVHGRRVSKRAMLSISEYLDETLAEYIPGTFGEELLDSDSDGPLCDCEAERRLIAREELDQRLREHRREQAQSHLNHGHANEEPIDTPLCLDHPGEMFPRGNRYTLAQMTAVGRHHRQRERQRIYHERVRARERKKAQMRRASQRNSERLAFNDVGNEALTSPLGCRQAGYITQVIARLFYLLKI